MNNSTKDHERLLIEDIEKNLSLYTKTELIEKRTKLEQMELRDKLNQSNGTFDFGNLTKQENSQDFTPVADYNLKPKVYQKKLEKNNNNGYVDKLLITLLVGFAGGVIATIIYIFINLGKFTFTF